MGVNIWEGHKAQRLIEVIEGLPNATQEAADNANEAAQAALDAIADLGALVAGEFSESRDYKKGEYVYYDGKLYRFTENHAAGAWSSSEAEPVPLGDDVFDIRNKFDRLFRITKNLYDPNAELDNEKVSSSGNTVTDADWATSDYIDVVPGEHYYCNSKAVRGAFYTEKTGAAGYLNNSFFTIDSPSLSHVFTAPANAKYMRVSIVKGEVIDYADGCMVCISTSDNSYSPFSYTAELIALTEDQKNSVINRENGTNLLNPKKLISGKRDTAGAIVSDSDYMMSELIEIESGESYYCNGQVFYVCFYNSEIEYVSGVTVTINDVHVIAAPSGTKYMRVSVWYPSSVLKLIDDAEFYFVCNKDDGKTYVPYGFTVDNISSLPNLCLNQKQKDSVVKKVPTKNIFNPDTITPNMKDNNGLIGSDSNYIMSDFIRVEEGTDYYSNATVFYYVFYNIDYTKISGGLITVNLTHVISAPENAAYVHISPYTPAGQITVNDGADNYMLCKNSEGMGYVPFGFSIEGLVLNVGGETKEGVPGLNFFTVNVDNSNPGTSDSHTESQSNKNIVAVNAVIQLPGSYTQTGRQTKCIMICHGAGYGVSDEAWGHFGADSEYGDSTSFNNLKNALLNAGYGLMDINGSENTLPFYSWGCRRTIDAYRKLYEYCVEHFNISPRIGVYGFSMGGIVSLNFVNMNREIVAGLALGCPTVDLYGTYKYARGFRRAIARAYLFEGTEPMWTDEYTQAEDQYYQDNIELTYGQDPWKHALLIGQDYYIQALPPIRIWYGSDDTGVSLPLVQNFVEAVTNGGGRISLRMVSDRDHAICYGGDPIVNEEIGSWLNRFL